MLFSLLIAPEADEDGEEPSAHFVKERDEYLQEQELLKPSNRETRQISEGKKIVVFWMWDSQPGQSIKVAKNRVTKAAFTQAPGPESGFESGSQSTWERWSESGFESSLPPCKHNQTGSESGSESPCKHKKA